MLMNFVLLKEVKLNRCDSDAKEVEWTYPSVDQEQLETGSTCESNQASYMRPAQRHTCEKSLVYFKLTANSLSSFYLINLSVKAFYQRGITAVSSRGCHLNALR